MRRFIMFGPGHSNRLRLVLALLIGAVYALAFPKASVAGLAWLVPGALLAVTLGTNAGTTFRLGYVAGLVHWLVSLYWLLNIPVPLSPTIPIPLAPMVGWLALSAYLALYPAIWVWLAWRSYPSRLQWNAQPFVRNLDSFLAVGWTQRAAWGLGCAVAWVALEMIQTRLFSGFPWSLLGVSQYRILPLIQVSAWTGVYGVSFLIAWFSVSLLAALLWLLRPPVQHRGWSGELALATLAVAVTVALGSRVLLHDHPTIRRTVKMALIQPSIPQVQVWDPRQSAARFGELVSLSERALTNRPQVLVWPEAGVPSLLRWDTNLYGKTTLFGSVSALARQHRVWIVLGADDAEPNEKRREVDYFNSSFLINPSGEIAASYRKRHLVIFGEYVPLADWLPFLRRFTGVGGDFTAGPAPVRFHLPSLGLKTLVLICFEDIFPQQAREHVQADTDFLLNLTNNGWFGESAAQWQHAANAVFRAVENRRPLVRCSNNGLTCWIDPHGRLRDILVAPNGTVYGAGWQIIDLPIRELAGQTTFYWRHGDVFGWSCAALTALLVLWTLRGGRRGR